MIAETKYESNYSEGDTFFYKPDRTYKNIKLAIDFILNAISRDDAKGLEVDIEKDRKEIISRYSDNNLENSVELLHPERLKYWDYEKNKNLMPGMVLSGSHYPVFWKCDNCGYSLEKSAKSFLSTKKCCNCGKEF